jgi:eukaryotic-like serine/threonine-protein kinase
VIAGKILRNRYKIARQIGSGGFGITYLAEDTDLPGKPQCVVKHFRPKNSDRSALSIAKSLFDKEASALYKLSQLNDQIPQLFAHFEENGEFYLVQEFIDGHTLSSEICRGKQLSELEVSHLLLNILEVLAVVHQHGVIHRDIKPPNLMRRHRDGKIVLIDFGAVKEISTLAIDEQGQTSVTVGIGSSGYMPDEQANGKPKLCSDIYAVGMIGIQALTGVPPSQLPEHAETGEIIWRDRVQVGDSLAGVLNTMVKPHFSQRYRSAADALEALQKAFEDALPPMPIPIILATANPSARSYASDDLPMSQVGMSDSLTIIDTTSSDDSPTLVDLVDIPIPSDSGLAVSSSEQGDSQTLIAQPIPASGSPSPASVKVPTIKLAPRIITLGISGVGIAIACGLAWLSFSNSSIPNRPGIATTEASAPIATNLPKIQPIPSPNAVKGKILLQQGKVAYEGDLINGKPSGKGKIKAKTYACEGDFLNGELNGRGVCKYKNGDRYEGEFRNDKFNGKGKITYATGSSYKGEFRNDNLNGKGVLIRENGDRVEGIWEDGQLIERKNN